MFWHPSRPFLSQNQRFLVSERSVLLPDPSALAPQKHPSGTSGSVTRAYGAGQEPTVIRPTDLVPEPKIFNTRTQKFGTEAWGFGTGAARSGTRSARSGARPNGYGTRSNVVFPPRAAGAEKCRALTR